MATVKINFGNNAELWWYSAREEFSRLPEGVRADGELEGVLDELLHGHVDDVETSRQIAKDVIRWAAQLPGWSWDNPPLIAVEDGFWLNEEVR